MMGSGGAEDAAKTKVGAKVTLVDGKRGGTVKFVGETVYGPGIWLGIELEKRTGLHDGMHNGKRYFFCRDGHGIYVRADQVVEKNKNWFGGGNAAVRMIQSFVRGSKERQVTDHKKVFMAWNALDLDDEAQHHEQAATQDRVEALLRASHPSVSRLPNEISAATLTESCGISCDPTRWGEDIEVEAKYEGPRISFPVTDQGAADILHHVRSNPDLPIHSKFMAQILGRVTKLLSDQGIGPVHHCEVPADGKIIIFGDTHGQLADFLLVLQRHGPPSDKVAYLLNGDIADRGDNSVEIFLVILVYKLLHPDRVFINRGNHENHDINRKPAEFGGGFYDEVVYKMDGSVFLMFQQFFEMLPLVTVIQEQVCVLHGGIPRKEGLRLTQIDAIDRRRQCPKVVQTAEDAILFDLMWADPQDQRGIALAAQRGPNCRKFGPDVTKRFLSDNSLSLCIRSHEVPISLRGFEERHDGRLLTVFSASNYCGQAGNYGAVVVFDSDMSYTLEEHMAPDLDSMIKEYLGRHSSLSQNSSQPPQVDYESFWKRGNNAQVDLDKSREQMQADVIAKLEVKICQHRDQLWWFWKNEDMDNTGLISAAKWREGMTTQLNLDVPWFSLQRELAMPDENGNIDYRAFLQRVRNSALYEGLKNTSAGWEKLVVVKLYESILRCDMSLKQTLAEFDPDGDGVVSPWEFKQALCKAGVDIPDQQLNAIMRTIDVQDNKLDVASFLDRFQVVYSCAADQGLSNIETEEHRRIKSLLTKIGIGLLAGKSRVEVFEMMDINKDGFISRQEFFDACVKLTDEVSDEEIVSMWDYVDTNRDGHLNYFEFCAAFQVVDTTDVQGDAVAEIVEVIVSALRKNMSSLEFAFRFFDQKGLGHVSIEDFKAGLRALNAAVTSGPPLTDEQLDVLVEFVDKDHDGQVDYEEFLEAFKLKRR